MVGLIIECPGLYNAFGIWDYIDKFSKHLNISLKKTSKELLYEYIECYNHS